MSRTRIAGWLAVTALWGTEVAGCRFSLRGMSPALDQLLDTLTVTATLSMLIWSMSVRVARTHAERQHHHERELGSLNSYVAAVGKKVEDAGSPAGAPALSLVEREESAG